MGFSYAPAVQVRSGAERATLVRRTYGLVFLSVLVTMFGVAFTFTQQGVMDASARHPIIMMLCMFAPLFLAQRNARAFPKNVLFTLLFTFIEGVFIAPYLAFAEQNAPGTVGQAAVLTFAAFGGLTLYALVSRRDFSAWGSFFAVGLIVLFVAMLINMFVASAAAGLWISGVGVLVFSGLLVFDTWRILRSGTFGQDDYVFAAVQIYLDLLNMFLFILSLLGNRSRR
ncbi:MAG TPA: Bax inhibitor-1/YccA family protein [Gemmatimonadaceae bacterium]|nr:Bax inhibitor-1/YccA family protein [Gemmatimonadaceae bacterium]